MNNAIKLFRNAYINNKTYTMNHKPERKYFVLRHKNSGAYLLVNYNNKGLKIVEGETPSTHTGRGIGTRLRALITILSTMSGVPVKQFGEWFVARRPGNTNNRPPTTRILRNKLGWKPLLRNNGTNTYRSIFDPKRNNVSLALVVVNKQP